MLAPGGGYYRGILAWRDRQTRPLKTLAPMVMAAAAIVVGETPEDEARAMAQIGNVTPDNPMAVAMLFKVCLGDDEGEESRCRPLHELHQPFWIESSLERTDLDRRTSFPDVTAARAAP